MNPSVSNRQIFAFVLFSLQGLPVVSLARDMATEAGTGAWFTLTLATLLFIFPAAMLATLNRRFPGKTLYQYSTQLVGRPVSVVLAVVYIVYFLGFFALVARGAAEIIKADVLAHTPLKVILMLFIAVSLYVTSRGLASIGRVLEVVLLFFLPVMFFLHILMFSGGDKYNLLPLYNPSKTVTYLKAVPMALPAFVGYEVLAVLPFQPNNLKLGRRYAIGGVALVGALYILTVESCYSILGLADIVNYSNALVVAVRRIDAPYLEILRRADLVFLMTWMLAILCTLNIYNYCFHSIACELFPRAKRWLVMLVLGALAFAVGTLPSGYDDNGKILDRVLFTLAPLTGLIAPAVLLIMTRIRKDVLPKNT